MISENEGKFVALMYPWRLPSVIILTLTDKETPSGVGITNELLASVKVLIESKA